MNTRRRSFAKRIKPQWFSGPLLIHPNALKFVKVLDERRRAGWLTTSFIWLLTSRMELMASKAWSGSLFDSLGRADPAMGARSVMRAQATAEGDVDDEGAFAVGRAVF